MGRSSPKAGPRKKGVKPLKPKQQLMHNRFMVEVCIHTLRSGGELGSSRQWLIDALERIKKGEDANKIFGVGSTQGVSSRVNPVVIYKAVEHFSKSLSRTKAIDEVSDRVNLSREAVSKIYYEAKVPAGEFFELFYEKLKGNQDIIKQIDKVLLMEILSKK